MSVQQTSSSRGRCPTPPPRAPSSAHGGGCFIDSLQNNITTVSFVDALRDLQRNGTAKGAYIHDTRAADGFLIGSLENAERDCRYHFVEVRGGNCRVIERAYNFPMRTEWLVRPWQAIELALLQARRAPLAA
jgi:hypothetical protein